jgi:hypothetical protein
VLTMPPGRGVVQGGIGSKKVMLQESLLLEESVIVKSRPCVNRPDNIQCP